MAKKVKKNNFVRAVIAVFAVMIAYSALPLIPFYLMEGADRSDNNAYNVKKLSANKGSYFSFIVFGDNHSGIFCNDAATIKEIWHMNREDRFRKVPIDFVMSVGDVALYGL
jgi:hypothetical protein